MNTGAKKARENESNRRDTQALTRGPKRFHSPTRDSHSVREVRARSCTFVADQLFYAGL